jgi:hypothetical protein
MYLPGQRGGGGNLGFDPNFALPSATPAKELVGRYLQFNYQIVSAEN